MGGNSSQLLPKSNLLTQAPTRTLSVVLRSDAAETDGTEDNGFFEDSLTSTLLACTRARAYTHTRTHTHTVREEGNDRERAREKDGERERERERPTAHAYTHPN